MTDREQMRALKQIVNYVFDVDIASKNRRREFVNARITFAAVLRSKGFTTTKIGGYIGKDHATIVHYMRNVDWYLKTDADFKKKYEMVMDEFQIDHDPVYDMHDAELKKEIFSLRNENKSLRLKNEGLKNEQSETKTRYKRIENLIKIVDERTRMGTEEEIERRLNHFYNGVYDR